IEIDALGLHAPVDQRARAVIVPAGERELEIGHKNVSAMDGESLDITHPRFKAWARQGLGASRLGRVKAWARQSLGASRLRRVKAWARQSLGAGRGGNRTRPERHSRSNSKPNGKVASTGAVGTPAASSKLAIQ